MKMLKIKSSEFFMVLSSLVFFLPKFVNVSWVHCGWFIHCRSLFLVLSHLVLLSLCPSAKAETWLDIYGSRAGSSSGLTISLTISPSLSTTGSYTVVITPNWNPPNLPEPSPGGTWSASTVRTLALESRTLSGSWQIVSGSNGSGFWSKSGSTFSRTYTNQPDGTIDYRVALVQYGERCAPRGGGCYYDSFAEYFPDVKTVQVARTPSTPSSLNVPASSTDGRFTVSWGASSGTVTKYQLEREVTGTGIWEEVDKDSPTSRSVEENLLGGTSYTYRVRACSIYCSAYVTSAPIVIAKTQFTVVNTAPVVDGNLTPVIEGGYLIFKVTRTGNISYTQTVQYATVSGTATTDDYEYQSGTLTFSPGEKSKIIKVHTEIDGVYEGDYGDENLFLALSAPTNASEVFGDSAEGLIRCNDNSWPPPPVPVEEFVPPSPIASDRIGAINGSFRVNESGAATYSIPLMSATGTAGVAPSLSLNYSSSGGNGLLGQGWSLGGLSEITRCRQTYQQDLNPLPITWTKEDRFCLDGQRLVLESDTGSYGSNNSVYRTEIDSFVRVTLITTGSGDNEVPDYFDVERKDGSISRYGWAGTDTQGQSEYRLNYVNGSDASDVMTWSIRRMTDNVGNEMHFFYDSHAMEGQRIKSVRYAYGGNIGADGRSGYGASTEFIYEDRPDKQNFYLADRRGANTKRLTQVVVENDGVVLRRYHIHYDGSASVDDHMSRVWSIEECAGNGSCLPPTEFVWTLPRERSYYGPINSQLDIARSGNFQYSQVYGDINSDGYQDVVWLEVLGNGSGYELAYSMYNPATQNFAAPTVLRSGSSYEEIPGESTQDITINMVDYNADGRMDLMVWREKWDTVDIFLATPQLDGSWKLQGGGEIDSMGLLTNIFYKPIFVDVNADGLTDLLTGGGLYLLKRNSAQPVESNMAYSYQLDQFELTRGLNVVSGVTGDWHYTEPEIIQPLGDVDGDGAIDFLVKMTQTMKAPCGMPCPQTAKPIYAVAVTRYSSDPANKSFYFDYIDALENIADPEAMVPGDINGDGLSDLLYLHASYETGLSVYEWRPFISTGNELIPYSGLQSLGGTAHYGTGNISDIIGNAKKMRPGIIDLNSDGYADLYISFYNNIYVRYWDPIAGNFGEAQTIASGGYASRTSRFIYWDPDLEADLLDIGTSGTSKNKLSLRRAPDMQLAAPANLINQVTNGLGATTNIHYESLATTDHYHRIAGIGESLSKDFCEDDRPRVCWWVVDASNFHRAINAPFDYLPEGSTVLASETLNPALELFAPMPLVTRVESSAPSVGATGTYRTNAKAAIEYHYSLAKIQAGGRGMLGFRSLTTVDMQTGVETSTVYRQDWPFIGHPLVTEVRTADGALLRKADNDWDLVDASGSIGGGTTALGTVQPYLKKSIEQSFDLAAAIDGDSSNDAPLSTTIIENIYDTWGNPTDITHKQFQGQPDSAEDNWLLKTYTRNMYLDSGFDATHGLYSSQRFGRLNVSEVRITKKDAIGNIVDEQLKGSTFDYSDSNGLLIQEKIHFFNADGTQDAQQALTTHYQHDGFGNIIEATQQGWDGLNTVYRTTYTDYTADGRYVTASRNTYGQTTSSVNEGSRNVYGVPTEVRDITGTWTKMAYTPMGRQYWQHTQTGSSTSTELSTNTSDCPAGTVYKNITRSNDGGESQECFDQLGRSLRTLTLPFDGNGWIFQDTQYDLLGRVARQSEPYFSGSIAIHWTRFQYDLLGRVTQTTLPDNSLATTQYQGFTIITTNDAGNKHYETSDALGNIIEVRDNTGVSGASNRETPRVTYEYDALGNLTYMHSHPQSGDTVSGVMTTWILYDSLGRKILMDDPDKGQWSYQYNAFGELISQSSANQQAGDSTTMTYDALGRMNERIDYQVDGSQEGVSTWMYDNSLEGNSIGQLVALHYTGLHYRSFNALSNTTIPDYEESYEYDVYGRLILTNTALGDDAEFGIYRQAANYDQYGRPFQSFDIDEGSEHTGDSIYGVQHRYNAQGYAEATDDVHRINGSTRRVYHRVLAMNARGQVLREQRGDTLTQYAYDKHTGRLCYKGARPLSSLDIMPSDCDAAATYQSGATANDSDIQDLFYDWDSLGNLTSRAEYSGNKNLSETFLYDRLNRMIKATAKHGSELNKLNTAYDSLGNILSKTEIGTYYYGKKESGCDLKAGPHAVSRAGATRYCYDANGNNISSDDGRIIHYSSFDKPYELATSSHTTQFAYGPHRSRFLREDINTGDNQHTRTLYVGANEYVADLNSGTLEIKRMVAGTLHTLHYGDGALSETEALIFTDHLGSTDVITDVFGNLLQEQSFNAWGERRQATDWQTVLNGFDPSFLIVGIHHSGTTQGFTGHEMLDEFGIIHMNGRIYLPKLGRFLQADPFIQAPTTTGSLNRYSYVLNNPLNATDPSGYFGFLAAAAIGFFASELGEAFDIPILSAIGNIATCASGNWQCAAGFATGSTLGAGGSFEDALKNGLLAGASAYAFSEIGGAIDAGKISHLEGALYHGLTSGVMNELQGGKFGHGVASAFITKVLNVNEIIGTADNLKVARILTATVIGGTVSEATGGKFANGAITAAFAQIHNGEGQAERAENAKESNLRSKPTRSENSATPPPKDGDKKWEYEIGFVDETKKVESSHGLAGKILSAASRNVYTKIFGQLIDYNEYEIGANQYWGYREYEYVETYSYEKIGGDVFRVDGSHWTPTGRFTPVMKLGDNPGVIIRRPEILGDP